VQILLGHARIATTAIYTHLTTPTLASLHRLLDRLMTVTATSQPHMFFARA
jgi:hypothetical protein